MYLQVTEQNIKKIRDELFPSLDAVSLKNVIVKNSGTDNIVDFSMDVTDYVGTDTSKKPKIFKNESVKDILKVKIFEINSQYMKNDLINVTSVDQIEYIIQKYGSLSVDLFACVDFIGDKSDLTSHYIEKNNITLSYKNKFILSREEIGFLSVGIVFYFDYKTYVKEQKIPEKFINKQTLNGGIKIIDLFGLTQNTGKDGVNVNPDIVQDLRVINKIFKSNEALEKINEQANFESKTTKILSNNEKKIDNTPFFSSPFYSRDTLGNLNLIFSYDFKRMIENYSNFSKIVKNTSFPGDIYDKCKISSLKIVRRQYDWNKEINKKPILRSTSAVCVIETSQDKYLNSHTLFAKDTSDGFIKEIDIFDDCTTVEVVDKTIYKSRNSFFQYGVEIKIDDGYPEYLTVLKDNLLEQVKVFKEYLLETENIVKTEKLSFSKNGNMTEGYFDPVNQSFTRRFSEEVFPKLYQDRLAYSISYFIVVLKVLGIIEDSSVDNDIVIQKITDLNKINPKKMDQDELASSLIAMISPSSANISTINYFIKVYEKVINQLNHFLKTSSNTSFNIEYWFEKDFIDASENPSVGYGFFDIQKQAAGFLRVDNSIFEEKIEYDIYNFTNSNAIDNKRQNLKYSAISPAFINSKNSKLNLNSIDNVKNVDFIDLELDIKRFNSLGDEEKEVLLDNDIKALPEKEQIIKLKTASYIHKFSGLIKNMYIELSDLSHIKLNGAITQPKQNTALNPNLLFLAMLKNTDKNTVFKNTKSALLLNKAGIHDADAKNYLSDTTPYQIASLIEKNDKSFTPNGIKYLNDLNHNSKFLFLYNTIHNVEILIKGKNIKDEKWVLLDTNTYNSLSLTKSYLCRLKLYQDEKLVVNNFEEISLPIYDKYFILQKKFTDVPVKKSVEVLKKKMTYSLPTIAENIVINTLPKTFFASPKIATGLNVSSPTAIAPKVLENIKSAAAKSPTLANVKINPGDQARIIKNSIKNQVESAVSFAKSPIAKELQKNTTIQAPAALGNLVNLKSLNIPISGALGAVIQPSVVQKNNVSKPPSEELQKSLVSVLSTPMQVLTSRDENVKNQSIIRDQDELLKKIIAPTPAVNNIQIKTTPVKSANVAEPIDNSTFNKTTTPAKSAQEKTYISDPVLSSSIAASTVVQAVSAFVPVAKSTVVVAPTTPAVPNNITTPAVNNKTSNPVSTPEVKQTASPQPSKVSANTQAVKAAAASMPVIKTDSGAQTSTTTQKVTSPQEAMKAGQSASKKSTANPLRK